MASTKSFSRLKGSERILQRLKDTAKTREKALSWFYNLVQSELRDKIPKSAFNPANDPFIGGMFFYIYDPKHKKTLKWYDKFPLTIPISPYSNGFLGLNMHYLPPQDRKDLLKYLKRFKEISNDSKEIYMKLSYDLLQVILKKKNYSMTIHRYLTNHIKTQLVKVDSAQWDNAILLPVQQFEKATASQVWNSYQKPNKRRKRG